jgi:hypothetical protein
MQPVRAGLLDAGDPSDTWERLQLLTQQLDVAVQGEDFKLAAQLRDQCKVGNKQERQHRLLSNLLHLAAGIPPALSQRDDVRRNKCINIQV